MIPITQALVAPNMMYYKGISESKGRKWQWITVHNTANDASATNEVSYMRSNYNSTSFHYAVDEDRAVQGLPDDIGAFDTDNRSFSSKGLSVEICYSKSGGERFVQAEKNAAEFIAYKLKQMGYPCDSAHVKTHQQASGKYCPHQTLDWGWGRFMEMIKKFMEDDDMTEAQVKKIADTAAKAAIADYKKNQEKKAVSPWAASAWQKATVAGVFDGTMPTTQLTREQAAMTFEKMGISELNPEKEASGWAAEAWDKAVEMGLVDGTAPRGVMTREMFIVVLDKMGLLEMEEGVLLEDN